MAINTVRGKFYIGSTHNFEKRKANHLRSKLNYPFQSALRKDPDSFVWGVWTDDCDESILEQALLDMWYGKGCCYNLNPSALHPPRDTIICKKGGDTVTAAKKGIHSSKWLNSDKCLEQRRKNGEKSFRENKGAFSLSPEDKKRTISPQWQEQLYQQSRSVQP